MVSMCTTIFKDNLQLVIKLLTDIELVRLFLHHHLMLLQVLLQVGCHAKLFVTVDTVEVKLVRCLLVRSQVPLVEEDHRALFTLDRPVHLVVHNLVREKREKERKKRREKPCASPDPSVRCSTTRRSDISANTFSLSGDLSSSSSSPHRLHVHSFLFPLLPPSSNLSLAPRPCKGHIFRGKRKVTIYCPDIIISL